MSTLRRLLLIVTLGIAASLLSSALRGTVPGLCPNVIGERPCALVAGGWPVRYIVDVPGISVEGSINLLSAIGSEDSFLVGAWLQDVAYWSFGWAVLGWAAGRAKKPARR
ncbi:hypothetical protein [Massilia sp. S19_KUP03_FR1]|uniref:hypothetical protein n=1 Tax=Massilia sp. S19_KUP03_FR1 TaxID=3025503 RepID=UPI002FCDB029